MKYIITVSTLFICGLFFSCNKYLDKKADNTLVVPHTLKDLQGLLDNYSTMNKLTPSLGDASCDDIFVTLSSYNSFDKKTSDIYTWQLKEYGYPNDWSNCYTAIYNTNYCLAYIGKIPKTPLNSLEWNNTKGSAFFFRAFYFLNLSWIYSEAYDEATAATDLGIVLRLGSDFNVPSVRTSVKEAYEQIISDLMKANDLLPDNPEFTIARPSKAASYALLARTYLSMRKYDSAYKYADLSLKIKSDLLDYNSPEISEGNVPFQPLNKEIIFYSLESRYYLPKVPTIGRIDTVLYDSYNNDDLRKKVFFRPSEGYQRFKGSYASNTVDLFSGLAVDEMYLIRAECNARLNRVDEAMKDLNTLLITRWHEGAFIPFVTDNKEEALEIILRERRKELLMRGIRWSDIKRLNKEGTGIVLKRKIDGLEYVLTPNDSRYALPIPKDVIDLTGIPQN